MKDIAGYEGHYAVTEDGQIYSYHKQGYLSQRLNKGYYYVSLKLNGEQKIVAVHRLVAQAFIPNPDNLPEVNHIDEDKKNNHFSNLEWCTHDYNIHYGNALKKSKATQQLTHPNKKKVLCMETGEIFFSTQEASRQTGINNTSISKVCNGHRKTAGGYHWQFID